MHIDPLFLLVFFLTAALLYALPFLSFATLPFGVRIPLAYAHDSSIAAERRRYIVRLGVLESLGLILNLVFGDLEPLRLLSLLALVVGGWGIYYLSHRRLAQIKVEGQWFAEARQVLIASAAPRSNQPAGLFRILLGLSGAVLLLTGIIGAWRYPALPGQVTFAFPRNLGSWTLETTPINAFLPLVFQIAATLILAGLAWMRSFGGERLDVEDPEGSQRYQQTNLQVIQALLLLLALGLNLALLASALVGWGLASLDRAVSDLFILAPLAGWLIVAPILLLQARPDSEPPAQPTGIVNRDDDRFWKLGMFYANPDDPSILVNKRFGIGRTLNFGNPAAWVILLALAALIVYRLITRV